LSKGSVFVDFTTFSLASTRAKKPCCYRHVANCHASDDKLQLGRNRIMETPINSLLSSYVRLCACLVGSKPQL
jgi:hypothetical protein